MAIIYARSAKQVITVFRLHPADQMLQVHKFRRRPEHRERIDVGKGDVLDDGRSLEGHEVSYPLTCFSLNDDVEAVTPTRQRVGFLVGGSSVDWF